MFFVEVDGHPLPVSQAGHPALELCNTWAGWNSPAGSGGDYLREHASLVTWARHHDLLTVDEAEAATVAAEAEPARATRTLVDTRRLRGRLYALLVPGHGDDPGALDAVSGLAAEGHAARRLVLDGEGSPTWRFGTRHAPAQAVRLPLLAAAVSSAELLTSPQRTAVHACPGDDCGWLFLDPRGRRKWCSMAVCGNRAKARAHAQRQRG